MNAAQHRAGFSLMEVNMAVFVMAIGILGMVALFPLGLREGVQARADLKQSMFADHALNQLVAILSQTNMTWQIWEDLADGFEGTLRECDEGVLEWLDKKALRALPMWEGDHIFLDLMEEKRPFFSLKLVYDDGRLTEAVLDGRKLR